MRILSRSSFEIGTGLPVIAPTQRSHSYGGTALTLVLVDAPREKHFTILPSELNETTNPRLNYLRLHGRNAEAYLKGKTVAARFDYDYSDQEIDEVVERARKLARSAGDVHVVFNNNNLDYAPRAALRLRASLGQIAAAPARQAELFPKR